MNINRVNNIIRYMLSGCFIMSGLLKAIGIDAFEQEVVMYGDAYIGDWVHDYSCEIAIAVCTIELVIGIAVLWHRLALFAGISLFVVLLFFVYLTGTNLFFPTILGRIETCGCFGELVHFTPISSFVKSVTLLLLSSINIYLTIKSEQNKKE